MGCFAATGSVQWRLYFQTGGWKSSVRRVKLRWPTSCLLVYKFLCPEIFRALGNTMYGVVGGVGTFFTAIAIFFPDAVKMASEVAVTR
jgi:hypothetical protein